MHLIRVGRRRINLEYLIMDEADDGTPETNHITRGGIRVTLETGREFDLAGLDAAAYSRQVDATLQPDPGASGEAPSPVVGHAVTRKRAKDGGRSGGPEQRKRGS